MADASSIISQADADRKAKGAAMLKALSLCQCAPEVFWNTEQSFTAFCPEGFIGDSVTKRVRAKQFFSFKSQTDANAKATAQAEALAKADLACVPASNFRIFAGQNAGVLFGDDVTSGSIPIGFGCRFNGTMYNSIFVNTNGNVTFGSGWTGFTPEDLTSTALHIIAGLWCDMGIGGLKPITFGAGEVVAGRKAFSAQCDEWKKLSGSSFAKFQIVLIDRSEIDNGFFDIEINYDTVEFQDGAYAGYQGYNFPNNGMTNAFVDSQLSTGLIHNQIGTPFDGDARPGRYTFQFREPFIPAS
jgi:hypothetical protein